MNSSSRQAVFQVTSADEIAAARRAAMNLARSVKFDETRAAKLAFLITEAATNVVKHAVRGEIIIRVISQAETHGIEVLVLDSGPGIQNLNAGMRSRVATGVSSNELTDERHGATHAAEMDAIGRQADHFDFYSTPGKGTVLWMRLWATVDTDADPEWDIGVVCLPIASEQECGDSWDIVSDTDTLYLMVADGLGHGPEAAMASQAAINVLPESGDVPPAVILQDAHHSLARTRGAAVAVARISSLQGKLHFAGVGNIEGCIIDGDAGRHMVSHNGIVGSNMRKVQEFVFPWTRESMLVMHSDGLGTRWNLSSYPGLCRRHPAVIAAVLYRDFVRRRDDVVIVVLRQTRQQ